MRRSAAQSCPELELGSPSPTLSQISTSRRKSDGVASNSSYESSTSGGSIISSMGLDTCTPTVRRHCRPSCSCLDKQKREERKAMRRHKWNHKKTAPIDEDTSDTSTKESTRELAHLFYAVQQRDLDLLTRLLSQCNVDLNTLNEDGIAVIHFAAMCGFSPSFHLLAMKGACLNLCDARGQCAVGYATVMEQDDALDCLMRMGAIDYDR